MVQPFPAPSLRELLSAAKLRECSLMNVSGQKFQSLYALVGNRWHGGTIGGHSLSLAFARQLPQRGSRDGCVPFNWVLAKIRGYGRFSSPLRRAGSIHRTARELQRGGGFSSPRRRAFSVHWGVLPRVNWYFIISVWRSRCMTPSAILRMSRDATKARVFSASSRGTL